MSTKTMRVAIVGAGPAGLYATNHLLEQLNLDIEIDLLERLPTPHGLVRAGVAPDHPEKKLVIDNMFNHYMNHPKVRFFGNVEVGSDVSHQDLSEWYDAVIYSVGASSDVRMNISGEDLSGSWAAREFVAWYNGHPDYSHLEFDFSSERAIIVGNGNVALDVARILTLPPEALRKTEIADYAIDALSKSTIREVVILGRRSHFQGAFNNPELEELEHLDDVDVLVDTGDLPSNQVQLFNDIDWQAQRKVDTLKRLVDKDNANAPKRIVLKFLSSPLEIIGEDKVSHMKVVSNSLQGEDLESLKAVATEDEETIEAGLILRAIGYRGNALDSLPFDERRGVIANNNGRIVQGEESVVGAYVTGWIKRGPRGVIGSNKKCARDTVSCLLEDFRSGRLSSGHSERDEVAKKLAEKKAGLVTMQGWNKIDQQERLDGRNQDRPRVKQTEWSELLTVAGV